MYSGAEHRPSGIVPSVTVASVKDGMGALIGAMEPASPAGPIRTRAGSSPSELLIGAEFEDHLAQERASSEGKNHRNGSTASL